MSVFAKGERVSSVNVRLVKQSSVYSNCESRVEISGLHTEMCEVTLRSCHVRNMKKYKLSISK